MQAAAVTTANPGPDRSSGLHRPTLVIIDTGLEATVVAFDTAFQPRIGDLFWHAGQFWEVVGWRAPARAFVACLARRTA